MWLGQLTQQVLVLQPPGTDSDAVGIVRAMPFADTHLYLPLSDRLLDSALKDAESFERSLSNLSPIQIGALIFLQRLRSWKPDTAVSLERLFATTAEIVNAQVKNDGLQASLRDFRKLLDLAGLREARRLLADFGIELVDEETLARRSYQTAEGGWDWKFRPRRSGIDSLERVEVPGSHLLLTDEQSRIFREVRGQVDEHLHVQGYAGTGKSSLVKALLSIFQPTTASILVLAERSPQVRALVAGMEGADIDAKTFGALASAIIPADLTRPEHSRMREGRSSATPMSGEELVRHLGIWGSEKDRFPPTMIAKAVRHTVREFCLSDDREIKLRHLPAWAVRAFDKETKPIVLHHAADLWNATISPREFRPPIHDYHRIKWAALERSKIPELYTHVLVDECHNLSAPMLQILECSPQAVISLGDEYQNLRGRAQRRTNMIRQREITYSVRSGREIDPIVNPIIAAHPGRTKLPFHGNASNAMEIVYYDKPTVPTQPAVILVNSPWELFEWAQRITATGVKVEFLSTLEQLNIFVSDCIEFFHERARPRHGALIRFRSWGEILNEFPNNRSVQLIDQMLRKGFEHKDWDKTLARFAPGGPDCYGLGLLEDARNREFASVMLAPEVIDSALDAKAAMFISACSAIYVAVTRAKRRLIVPERLREWVGSLSSSRAFG